MLVGSPDWSVLLGLQHRPRADILLPDQVYVIRSVDSSGHQGGNSSRHSRYGRSSAGLTDIRKNYSLHCAFCLLKSRPAKLFNVSLTQAIRAPYNLPSALRSTSQLASYDVAKGQRLAREYHPERS